MRVRVLHAELELGGEAVRADEVHHADADARRLVAVARADAAFGGADLALALGEFARAVELAMIREDHVGGLGNEEIFGRHGDAELGEAVEFFHEADGVEHDAVADDAGLVLAEDAGG